MWENEVKSGGEKKERKIDFQANEQTNPKKTTNNQNLAFDIFLSEQDSFISVHSLILSQVVWDLTTLKIPR
jgi:hypothetical protein